MKRVTKLAAASALAVFGIGSALAFNPGPPPYVYFDLNGDGYVSHQEFEEVRAQRRAERAQLGYPMRNLNRPSPFQMMDQDGDGYISATEMDSYRAQMRANRWGNAPNAPGPCPRGWRNQ